MTIGLYPEGIGVSLYDQLLQINPCMMMAPKGKITWLVGILKTGSPSAFLGNNPNGRYAPILWYALPVYLGISIAAFAVFALLNWKDFRKSMKKH